MVFTFHQLFRKHNQCKYKKNYRKNINFHSRISIRHYSPNYCTCRRIQMSYHARIVASMHVAMQATQNLSLCNKLHTTKSADDPNLRPDRDHLSPSRHSTDQPAIAFNLSINSPKPLPPASIHYALIHSLFIYNCSTFAQIRVLTVDNFLFDLDAAVHVKARRRGGSHHGRATVVMQNPIQQKIVVAGAWRVSRHRIVAGRCHVRRLEKLPLCPDLLVILPGEAAGVHFCGRGREPI